LRKTGTQGTFTSKHRGLGREKRDVIERYILRKTRSSGEDPTNSVGRSKNSLKGGGEGGLRRKATITPLSTVLFKEKGLSLEKTG